MHSSLILNGEATTANMSAVSKNQETHNSNNTEALTKLPRSSELDGAAAGLSPGKRQSFN